MNVNIYEALYKNINCIVMETDRLVVKVIPESGSKIQSIYDKLLKREYLYQSPNKEFIKSTYASNFGDGDLSGFDEVFPSIEQCFYPSGPWKGTNIPDHGEVWALPWEYKIDGATVTLNVSGVRFPYRLEKRIEFLSENIIRISYNALNPSNFDFYFTWAPHTLFNCEQDTVITLPDSVKKIISTCSVENKLGKFGNCHSWPTTVIGEEAYDISKVYPKYPGKCEKYYAMGQVREGWCALRGITSGVTIGLSYPVDKVPYLGVWEGIINGRYVAALEPCTGDLDYLDTAVQWSRACSIKARSEYEWYLNFSVQNIKSIKEINSDGIIIEKI